MTEGEFNYISTIILYISKHDGSFVLFKFFLKILSMPIILRPSSNFAFYCQTQQILNASHRTPSNSSIDKLAKKVK